MTPFAGETFEPDLDTSRLTGQLARVKAVVTDGRWRTLSELEHECQAPQASVSARLRDLRKPAFGRFHVERRRRGEPQLGLFEYRVLPPLPSGQLALEM